MIYLLLFFTFFKIGLFTFGGGHAMVPLIQSETEKLNWLTQEELINFIGIAESTPGAFAVNIATFIGYRQGSLLGAIAATLGIILPSIIIILIIARFWIHFSDNKFVKHVLENITPAALGLITVTFITIAMVTFNFTLKDLIEPKTLASKLDYISIALFIIMLVAKQKFNIHPIIIMLICGIIGIFIF